MSVVKADQETKLNLQTKLQDLALSDAQRAAYSAQLKAIEQAELPHHFERGRVNSVAAKIAQKISVFFQNDDVDATPLRISNEDARSPAKAPLPNLEAKYRALVEQIPAVVFMASLDDGIGAVLAALAILVIGKVEECLARILSRCALAAAGNRKVGFDVVLLGPAEEIVFNLPLDLTGTGHGRARGKAELVPESAREERADAIRRLREKYRQYAAGMLADDAPVIRITPDRITSWGKI